MIRFGNPFFTANDACIILIIEFKAENAEELKALYREMTKDSNQPAVPSFQDTAVRETRVFLQKCKVFRHFARGTDLRPQVDCNFRFFIAESASPGQAVKGGERIVNVVGFRSCFARFIQALARIIPPANIHHGHAALVMPSAVRGFVLWPASSAVRQF